MIVACILSGGPTLRLEVAGEVVLFEWHDYMGPLPVTKRGAERRLGPRHPFWQAVSWWAQQGKRVTDGLCTWDREPHPMEGAVHAGGRNWVQPEHPSAASLIANGAKVWREAEQGRKGRRS